MPSQLNMRARVRPWVAELLQRAHTPRTPLTAERVVPMGLGAIAALLAVGGIGLMQKRSIGVNAAERTLGKLTVDSRPAGADVLVDGQRRGTTPATISVSPGRHTLIVRRGTDARTVALTIAAGAEVAEHFELAASDTAFRVPGRIVVSTDPPGARIAVDGQLRGVSPTTIDGVSPATHTVRVSNGDASAERVVSVEPGGTTSVVFSRVNIAAPLAGWLSVDAPFDVEIADLGEVVGTSGTPKIMLAAGEHDLVFTNERLGYQEHRRTSIAAGKIATIKITPAKAAVNVNARPWGEVLVDGVAVGQTPLANLPVPIGTHDVVFRHPQFGERRQTIVVTAQGPNRVTEDFTK